MNSMGVARSAGSADLPPELRGWNWGAFGLNWIWGIANRCYFALLVFVPFLGLFVPFVLGAKGNAWAWQNRRWESLEHFRRAQRSWARYTLLAYAVIAALAVGAYFAFSEAMRQSEAFVLASSQLRADPRITDQLGTPLEFGSIKGSVEVAGGGSGGAELAFPVTGPLGTGEVYVVAKQALGSWAIEQLVVELADGRRIPLHANAPQEPEPAEPHAAALAPVAAAASPDREILLTATRTQVRGGLSRKVVEEVLARELPTLAQCLANSELASSDMTLKLIVSPKGAVQTGTLKLASGDSAPALDRCARSLLTRWEFPAPKGGGLVVVDAQLRADAD